jgi:hypothetical protein
MVTVFEGWRFVKNRAPVPVPTSCDYREKFNATILNVKLPNNPENRSSAVMDVITTDQNRGSGL